MPAGVTVLCSLAWLLLALWVTKLCLNDYQQSMHLLCMSLTEAGDSMAIKLDLK